MKTQKQIQNLGPWISKFVIDGIDTGGWFDVLADGRVNRWLDMLKGPLNVLECGSLEGGHTALIARHPNVRRVIGLEGRVANLLKCRFIHKMFGIGQFDATFCSGVLYQLLRPVDFFNRIESRDVFLGTHYSLEHQETFEGMRGRWYQEHGLVDVLSGMSDKSFWLTIDNIEEMIAARGYKIIELQTSDSQNGPWVNVIASKER